jgi:hypothetical protein
MSYLTNFEQSFCKHTLQLMEKHENEREFPATLLINCLLGLLVLPSENAFKAIPDDKLETIAEWGLDRSCIRHPGRVSGKANAKKSETLHEFTINLRHAVAHFNISPVPTNGDVKAFRFINERNLDAELPLDQLRVFAKKLAAHFANS